MANAIVSFGVTKLWDLVSQQSARLSGVKEQVTELETELKKLSSFLSDVEERKQTTSFARNCVDDVKEIIYDAEDIIETYLLKQGRCENGGIKNHMKSLACIPFVRRKTALQITSITKRISKVIQDMQNVGILSKNFEGGYPQAQQDRKEKIRHTYSSESKTILVGLEKNVERLVEELVENDSNHGVSITGLGGLGKTTLARAIFNHMTIKCHFDGLVWVCVSQDCKRKNVWQTILWTLSPGDKDREMSEDELQVKLVQLLKTKKALIVFDDLWTNEDWNLIKPVFPVRKAASWKVLLTSRNEAVNPECVTFKPELLQPDECWTLLQMIAFPKNETGYIIDKDMEDMAKEMIKHCGGLPLAVEVLGGLLAAEHTSHQWKLISENIKSLIVRGSNSNVEDILSLSFEGLPSELKQCLLYLAIYPEDHKVELNNLSYVWAAEGILKLRHYEGATIRDVADLYIKELVMRNMVISERDKLTSRFEKCQLHDLMREICLLKGKEENFLQIVSDPTCSSSGHSQASSKSRRLVVYRTKKISGEREIKNSKLRSLLFIGTSFWMGSNFMKLLPLLRVLDLEFVTFKGGQLPSSIGKLIHLKYLSLHLGEVTHLPASIRNLKSLLYFNLSVRGGMPDVPNVFKHMVELRFLYLPKITNGRTKLELGNLLNLETLYNFSTKHSSVTDLHRMSRLRSLSFYISNEEWGMVSSTLCKLGKLEDLTIKSYEDDNHLKQQKLPDVQHLPSHLIDISLYGCRLEEDPMPILGKLLQLKTVSLLDDVYVGRRMVCSDGGFPKLQILRLDSIPKLEEWTVEEGSMPCLHTLYLRRCSNLKKLPVGQRFIIPKLQKLFIWDLEEWEEWIVEEGSMPLLHSLTISNCDKLKLPDGLRFITSLKEFTIRTKERELQNKVSKGGEDYYKIQHIPLIRYDWDEHNISYMLEVLVTVLLAGL
ncbi:putative disease resistance protein At1g59780 isoform X2 [Capsella rubella]|nr:putative disease resistance protein At1g59780 isoform X2 [Capsella rubella]